MLVHWKLLSYRYDMLDFPPLICSIYFLIQAFKLFSCTSVSLLLWIQSVLRTIYQRRIVKFLVCSVMLLKYFKIGMINIFFAYTISAKGAPIFCGLLAQLPSRRLGGDENNFAFSVDRFICWISLVHEELLYNLKNLRVLQFETKLNFWNCKIQSYVPRESVFCFCSKNVYFEDCNEVLIKLMLDI